MTDPRNPQDPNGPREGDPAAEQWTWQRPDDGSPVYGDQPGGQIPSPPPDGEPAEGYEYTQPQPPAGQGYAQQGQYPPTSPQPPISQESYPPQPWASQGAPPPPGGPAAYGGYTPDYSAAAPPPASGVNKGMFSLFISFFSLFMALCCCPPIGIIGGIVGAVMGWSGMQQAKATGQSGTTSALGFWLSIAAILLAFVSLIINIIVQIYYPEMYSDMLRDFGLG